MKNRQYFELYENGKKIIRINKKKEFDKGTWFRYSMFNSDGSELEIPQDRWWFLTRQKNGRWGWGEHMKLDNMDKDIDLVATVALAGAGNYRTNKPLPMTKEAFAITLHAFPPIPYAFGFSPFGIQTHIPWKLTGKTDDQEVLLNNEIIFQHQRAHIDLGGENEP